MNTPIKGMKVCHSESLGLYWIEDADGKTVCDFYIRISSHLGGPDDAHGHFHRFPNAKALAHQFAASGEVMEWLQQGVDLIDGDLTGVEWKRACRIFLTEARAAIALAKGDA